MRYAVSALVGTGALATLLAFLPKEEGLSFVGYLDPLGVPTTCVGSTTNVQVGKVYSKAECDARLKQDIQNAWDVVYRNVPRDTLVRMHPKTQAAFTSFVFHMGPGGKGRKDGFVYLKSGGNSTMFKLLVAGNIEAACKEFPKWNKQQLRGITLRQQRTMEMCLDGVKESKQ